MKAAPVSIPLSWGSLAGLHWAKPGAPKLVCLHGWLDNAASFVPLAPYLGDFDLVALDFAGHGLSAHRPQASHYYFTEYLFDIDAAMDRLGWDRCHFIGHSLGGGVASCFAAAMPEKVDRLVLLDSLGLLTLAADQAAAQLRASMLSVRKTRSFLRPYPSIEEAMLARQKKSPLSDQAARLLCERSLEHSGDNYQWRTDPRLNWRSPQLSVDEQALEMLAAIRTPTLLISTDAMTDYFGKDMAQRRLRAIPGSRHVGMDGHHHFHMEQPQQVAAHITTFLHQQDQSQGAHHDDS